jgi:hypothetical protein
MADESGDYDDDFHEMSVSGSDNLSKGEQETPKPGSTVVVSKQSELQDVSGPEDGGRDANRSHQDEASYYDEEDEYEREDNGDDRDQIETEVDPTSGILKLGQPVQEFTDERLQMSGGRFKFPDEMSRDDLDQSRDRFAEIYADSPDQQRYIENTIQQTVSNQYYQEQNFNHQEHEQQDTYYDEEEYLNAEEAQLYYDDPTMLQHHQHPQGGRQKKAQKKNTKNGAASYARGNPLKKPVATFGGGVPSKQKQLDMALKRLSVAERERKILEQKLNHSSVQKELVHLRSLAGQQGKKLKAVMADNRALEGRMRHQAHKLQEAEQAAEKMKEYGNHSSMSSDRQIEILLDRVRRLTTQVKQLREASREKDERLKVQGSKVQKLKAYIVDNFKKHEAAVANNNKAVPSIVQESTVSAGPGPAYEEGGSLVDGSVFAEAAGSVEGMSELQMLRFQLDQLDKEGSQTSNTTGKATRDGTMSKGSIVGKQDQDELLRRTVAQLQRSLGVQKKGYVRQIKDLTHELKESRENEQRLEQLLDERERHARAQVVAVKQLRRTCQELEEGNNRLMLASDVYSRPVQQALPEQPHVSPVQTAHSTVASSQQPQSQGIEYSLRGGPAVVPSKPKGPASSQSSGYNSRPAPPGRKIRDDSGHSGGRVFL